MAPDEYGKALDKALSDLQQRVQQRDLLTAEIAGLRETVRVLSTLVTMPSDKQREVARILALADYATPSLTDAIRALLTRVSPKEMTAIEVRNALEDSSNSEEFANSLSACHAALKRMLSDGEVEPGPTRNGKASYKLVPTLESQGLGNLSALRFILGGGFKPNIPADTGDAPHPTQHINAPKPPLTPGEAKRMMEALRPKK
jgi:hypothetical protein